MENQDIYSEESIAKAENSAAEMIYQGGKSLEYVIAKLETKGYDKITATRIAQSVMFGKISEENKDEDLKNIVVGAFFFILGTILTISDLGYIFWGAILFGGIQFFRGLSNYIS